ncbi:MAG: hypothetical protein ACYTBJ_10700 [Planctomycetota bacterium]
MILNRTLKLNRISQKIAISRRSNVEYSDVWLFDVPWVVIYAKKRLIFKANALTCPAKHDSPEIFSLLLDFVGLSKIKIQEVSYGVAAPHNGEGGIRTRLLSFTFD